MEANSDKDADVQTGKKDLSVLEMIQIPVFVADQDGKMVYGNDAFAELVGVKRDQLPGSPGFIPDPVRDQRHEDGPCHRFQSLRGNLGDRDELQGQEVLLRVQANTVP